MVWPNAKSLVLSHATHYSVNIQPQSIAWLSFFFFSFILYPVHGMNNDDLEIHSIGFCISTYIYPIHIALLSSFVTWKFSFFLSLTQTKHLSFFSVSVARPLSSILDFHYDFRASKKRKKKKEKKVHQRRQFNKPFRILIWTINYLACKPLTHEILLICWLNFRPAFYLSNVFFRYFCFCDFAISIFSFP